MKYSGIDFVNDDEQRNAFLSEVTQQLTQAVSRDDMQAVLEQLPKNALEALASSESIVFPRALSRMKKAEMIAILLDEIIRRAEIIKNGEELTINGSITPLMEAAYKLQGKSEYVAETREKQQAEYKALSDSIVVRVVDWDAVDKQKNSADIPVSKTELQPEDTTVENNGCDYSTECAQSESSDVESDGANEAENMPEVSCETEDLPDDVIPVEEAFSLPAVPLVEEIKPVTDNAVIRAAFKWHYVGWDDFSVYTDEHLLLAGEWLGLRFSPSISRDDAIRVLNERMQAVLMQTPDEETYLSYCENIVQKFIQKPAVPVAPVKRNSKLSALLDEADKAVFSSEELQAVTRQAFMDTRRFACNFRAKAHRWGRNVPVRKQVADSPRQYKIEF